MGDKQTSRALRLLQGTLYVMEQHAAKYYWEGSNRQKLDHFEKLPFPFHKFPSCPINHQVLETCFLLSILFCCFGQSLITSDMDYCFCLPALSPCPQCTSFQSILLLPSHLVQNKPKFLVWLTESPPSIWYLPASPDLCLDRSLPFYSHFPPPFLS